MTYTYLASYQKDKEGLTVCRMNKFWNCHVDSLEGQASIDLVGFTEGQECIKISEI